MSARAYPFLVPHNPTRSTDAGSLRPSALPSLLVALDLPGGLVLKVERRGPADVHARPQDHAAPTAPTVGELARVAKRLAGQHFKITLEDLCGRSRSLPIVTARHAVWWLLREHGFKSTWIGRQFGRDHTTILYGVRTLTNRMETEPELRAVLAALLVRFNAELTRG